MRAQLLAAAIAFALAGTAAAQLPGIDAPTGAGVGAGGSPPIEHKVEGSGPVDDAASARLKDAVGLCDRLGGVERDLCMQQARENVQRDSAPAIGATPGSGASGSRGKNNVGATPR